MLSVLVRECAGCSVFPRRINISTKLIRSQKRYFSHVFDSEFMDVQKLLGKKDSHKISQYILKQWSTKFNVQIGTQPSIPTIPSMITALYVSKSPTVNNNNMNVAFQLVETIYKSNRTGLFLAYLEFVNYSIEHNLIDEAMSCVHKIKRLKKLLPPTTVDNLVSKLSVECRIDDLMLVMDMHSISELMLIASVEPLLMSGLHQQYFKYLQKYLLGDISEGKEKNCELSHTLPHPNQAISVLQAFVITRIRIGMSSGGLTEADSHVLTQINDLFDDYHTRFIQESTDLDDATDLKHLPTAALLEDVDSGEYSHMTRKRDLTNLEMFEDAYDDESVTHPTSRFAFLMEDKLPFDSIQWARDRASRSRSTLRVKDLTGEVTRKQRPAASSGVFSALQRPMLYSHELFPGAFTEEIAEVRAVVENVARENLMEALQNWREMVESTYGAGSNEFSDDDDLEGNDIDDDGDEDEEDDEDDDDDDEDLEFEPDEEEEEDEDADGMESNASVNGDSRPYELEIEVRRTLARVGARRDMDFGPFEDIYYSDGHSDPEAEAFNNMLENLGQGDGQDAEEKEWKMTMRDLTKGLQGRSLVYSEWFFHHYGNSDEDEETGKEIFEARLKGSSSSGGGGGGKGSSGGVPQIASLLTDDETDKGDDDDSGLSSSLGVLEVGAVDLSGSAGSTDNRDRTEEN